MTLGLPFAPEAPWVEVAKFDRACALLADRHYSRRKVGSPQFMPPGDTLVLATPARDAVFGWWRPHPSSGIVAMNGLDGWTCSIFRNEGPATSSALILAAESMLVAAGRGCGPSGLLTYVFDSKIRSVNPGYCFKRAGWHTAGRCAECRGVKPRSADGRKTLLHKAWSQAGIARQWPRAQEAA